MLIRQVRMRQFSPGRLFEYEKIRREVRVQGGAEHEAVVAGRIFTPMAVNRYGTTFSSFVMNLAQREQLVLQLESHRATA